MQTLLAQDNIVFYVVDVETTGLNACCNNITSIALHKFDFHEEVPELTPDNTMHLAVDPVHTRIDNEETMKWRAENFVSLNEDELVDVDASTMLYKLDGFLRPRGKTPVLLSWHTDFDVAFLRSYLAQYARVTPWNHQLVFDIPSLILGAGFDRKVLDEELQISERWGLVIEKQLLGECVKHIALHDAIWSKEMLYLAMRNADFI